MTCRRIPFVLWPATLLSDPWPVLDPNEWGKTHHVNGYYR